MMSTARRQAAQLACGIAAGPILLGATLLDGATRAGYDPFRHGVSQLTSGERGWLARAAFVACGILIAVFARGAERAGDPGGTWGPRLLGATAAGLVLAGLFPTDPALGYPPHEAEGTSLAGAIHQLGGFLLFGGLIGAAFSSGRHFARSSRPRWAAYSITTGTLVTTTALAAGVIYRLVQEEVLTTGPAGLLELISIALAFAWVLLLAVDLRTRG
jgi:hypothetical protein